MVAASREVSGLSATTIVAWGSARWIATANGADR